jgi:HSP20 family protein
MPAWPSVEITDTDKEVRVSAELPGREDKDVELLMEDGVLTPGGEKRSKVEDRARQFTERSYGRFERRIPLGFDLDEDVVQERRSELAEIGESPGQGQAHRHLWKRGAQ